MQDVVAELDGSSTWSDPASSPLWPADVYGIWTELFGGLNPLGYPGLPYAVLPALLMPGGRFRLCVQPIDLGSPRDQIATVEPLWAYLEQMPEFPSP